MPPITVLSLFDLTTGDPTAVLAQGWTEQSPRLIEVNRPQDTRKGKTR
jgi:hypothetical protein